MLSIPFRFYLLIQILKRSPESYNNSINISKLHLGPVAHRHITSHEAVRIHKNNRIDLLYFPRLIDFPKIHLFTNR